MSAALVSRTASAFPTRAVAASRLASAFLCQRRRSTALTTVEPASPASGAISAPSGMPGKKPKQGSPQETASKKKPGQESPPETASKKPEPGSTSEKESKKSEKESPLETASKKPEQKSPAEMASKKPKQESPSATENKKPKQESPSDTASKKPKQDSPSETASKKPKQESPSEKGSKKPKKGSPSETASKKPEQGPTPEKESKKSEQGSTSEKESKKPKQRPPKTFMFPLLHQKVLDAVADEVPSLWFSKKDSDEGSNKAYQTHVMGKFACNHGCSKRRWSSKKVAIWIRRYPKNGYNAVVYNQSCKSCEKLGILTLDEDSYVERVAYRVKKWAGIKMEPMPYEEQEGLPHRSGLCEGCKQGKCKDGGVEWTS